jgi:hypothetical protein
MGAGTYRITAIEPFYNGSVATEIRARLRLRNITDATTLLTSQNQVITANTAGGGAVTLTGIYTLSGTKALEVQYYINSSVTTVGRAFNVTGEVEWYLYVLIEQI